MPDPRFKKGQLIVPNGYRPFVVQFFETKCGYATVYSTDEDAALKAAETVSWKQTTVTEHLRTVVGILPGEPEGLQDSVIQAFHGPTARGPGSPAESEA